jgi:D-glycero-D-manno-heptose 1,7-bisphosphate phosphatase
MAVKSFSKHRQPPPRKAVFIDKDGTLVEDIPYNADPEQIRLMPDAVQGAHILHAAGYALIVISNQSGVAHGYYDERALGVVENCIRELLALMSVPLTDFYYCPHHPEGRIAQYTRTCDCRKPAPGLILRAAREHNLNLAQSWFIGDILHDIEAGHRAGCKTMLLDNGNETEWVYSPHRRPDWVVPDLAQAACVITATDPIQSGMYHQHG